MWSGERLSRGTRGGGWAWGGKKNVCNLNKTTVEQTPIGRQGRAGTSVHLMGHFTGGPMFGGLVAGVQTKGRKWFLCRQPRGIVPHGRSRPAFFFLLKTPRGFSGKIGARQN